MAVAEEGELRLRTAQLPSLPHSCMLLRLIIAATEHLLHLEQKKQRLLSFLFLATEMTKAFASSALGAVEAKAFVISVLGYGN